MASYSREAINVIKGVFLDKKGKVRLDFGGSSIIYYSRKRRPNKFYFLPQARGSQKFAFAHFVTSPYKKVSTPIKT